MNSVIIDTPCGKLEGLTDGTVRQFLGIPFARAERFKYPMEVTHWEGIQNACQYGAVPYQKSSFDDIDCTDPKNFYAHEMQKGINVTYSEDCLNLNIWAPEKADHAPVLIVIHGGGLVEGKTQELIYDGEALARKGIVVCFLSYRLGIFGFIALKVLADRDGRTGNYGYFDQQKGIEWVRHNIAAFGGDPENMTLAGQSAGAASCEAQIKSPLNKGYFKQAFIQSSAGFTTCLKAKDNRNAEYAKWQKIYDASGCASLAEFVALPAEQLFRLFEKESDGKMGFCTAIYDEEFCSSIRNEPCSTKIMIGITAQDVMPAILYFLSGQLKKSQMKAGVPTYRYFFKRQLPGDTNGAWHGSDLWYFYGALHKCWRPFTEEDNRLAEVMQRYAANFMKSGDPNGDGLNEWNPMGNDKNDTMIFDAEQQMCGKPSVAALLKETFWGKHLGM